MALTATFLPVALAPSAVIGFVHEKLEAEPDPQV